MVVTRRQGEGRLMAVARPAAKRAGRRTRRAAPGGAPRPATRTPRLPALPSRFGFLLLASILLATLPAVLSGGPSLSLPPGERGGHPAECGTLPGLLASALSPAAWAASTEEGGEIPTELDVPVRAKLSREAVPAGGEAVLAVVYDIPPDAHIQVNDFLYAQPKEGEPVALGAPTYGPAIQFEGEPVYIGRTVAYYKVRFPDDLPPGTRSLNLLAGYQACIEKPVFACFAPVDVELSVPVEILAAGAEPRP